MTEAQKCLYHIAENMRMDKSISKEGYEYFQQAIKALEQEPCEDAVSRQAVLDLVNADWKYEGLESYIKDLPPVTPQPKTGHWIKQVLTVKPFGEDTVLCNQCAFMTVKDNEYNYCPNCGAKMIKSQESEE